MSRARRASGQPAKKNMASYQNCESISWCAFTWRTILQNFVQIRVEMTALWAVLEDRCPDDNNKNNSMSISQSVNHRFG